MIASSSIGLIFHFLFESFFFFAKAGKGDSAKQRCMPKVNPSMTALWHLWTLSDVIIRNPQTYGKEKLWTVLTSILNCMVLQLRGNLCIYKMYRALTLKSSKQFTIKISSTMKHFYAVDAWPESLRMNKDEYQLLGFATYQLYLHLVWIEFHFIDTNPDIETTYLLRTNNLL